LTWMLYVRRRIPVAGVPESAPQAEPARV